MNATCVAAPARETPHARGRAEPTTPLATGQSHPDARSPRVQAARTQPAWQAAFRLMRSTYPSRDPIGGSEPCCFRTRLDGFAKEAVTFLERFEAMKGWLEARN